MGYKRTRAVYLALVIGFYVSIPVAWNADVVAMLVHGYSLDVSFRLFDRVADREMAKQWDEAYQQSVWLMHYVAVGGVAIWVSAFISTIWALFIRIKKRIILLPYLFDYMTLIASSIMLVLVVLILLQPAFYGMG